MLGTAAGEPAQDLLGLRGAQAQRGGVFDDLVVLLADQLPVDRLGGQHRPQLRPLLVLAGSRAVQPGRPDVLQPGEQVEAEHVREELTSPGTPPAIAAPVNRWLSGRLQTTDRAESVRNCRDAFRYFLRWLAQEVPDLTSLVELTRAHIEGFLTHQHERINPRNGRPLSARTRYTYISPLLQFFRETSQWGWTDVPARPLLGRSDLPKLPSRLPRFIPRDELDRLMQAVEDLEDPHQRTALLLLRWSGARRGEITRLPVDCLDAYPDGYPRLRIPVGKTYTERMIPLHPQAADALRSLIETAKAGHAAARHDPWAQRSVRYMFMRRGKPMGKAFLFDDALEIACRKAGLLDGDGNHTVTAHRFRHSVGTQLAEGGAQIQTIMAILGHRSAQMSAAYSHISDPVLKEQYEKVIAAGGRIAGPAAEALLAHQLGEETVHWLNTNFFKTETRTRPLPAHPGRRTLRVRPLPALLEVLHDQRVRTAPASPSCPRTAARPGRHRAWMATRSRAAHRHHRPHQGPLDRTRRAHRTDRHRHLQLIRNGSDHESRRHSCSRTGR